MRAELTIFALMIVWLGGCTEQGRHADRLNELGEISTIGRMDQTACAYGSIRTAEIIDGNGVSVTICTGPGGETKHYGFFLLPKEYAEISMGGAIPVEGVSEREVIEKIYRYLYRRHTPIEIESWYSRVSGECVASEDEKSRMLVTLLHDRDSKVRDNVWLTTNYSTEEQDRIFNTEYSELSDEREKYAYRIILGSHGGILVTQVEELNLPSRAD